MLPKPRTDVKTFEDDYRSRKLDSLSIGERIKQLEVEGYVLIPNLLSTTRIEGLLAELNDLQTAAVSYSDKQQ